MSSPSSPMRQRQLAVALAALLILAPAPALASSVFVTNCQDSGAGTLRYAALHAASGDTVDLTSLSAASPGCAASTITLTTGAIRTATEHLTISGPTSNRITVSDPCPDSAYDCRVFNQTTSAGDAYLEIDNLTVSHGRYSGTRSYGGCIRAHGVLKLTNVTVDSCTAATSDSGGFSQGGAIDAKSVFLYNSTVSNSTASSDGTDGSAIGGGIAANTFLAVNSTIARNSAVSSNSSLLSVGGGIFAGSALQLTNSTVSSNSASAGGGLFVRQSATIDNSTIIGNTATDLGGGGILIANCSNPGCGASKIRASTIASNTAANATFSDYSDHVSAGLALLSNGGASIYSNIIANNIRGDQAISDDFSSKFLVSGDHNLIRVPVSPAPADTIAGKCPILGSLRFNGGPTATVALESGSPGINQGVAYAMEDQRGLASDAPPYTYPRVSGPAADIGAYEVEQDEIIFTANFEGCP